MTTRQEQHTTPRCLKILVVEDSPTQAEYLLRLLADEPAWRVRTAPDGLQALAMAHAERPDLVISDVAMPGIDGYALCRALKAEPGGAALPIMLLTRLNTLEDIVRALEAGADAFVSKPFDPDQLRERVRRLLLGASAAPALDGAPERPLEFMPAERRQVLELLVATHEAALRTNAQLAEREAGLARLVGNLELLNRVAGALNGSATEAEVAAVVLQHVPQLPGVRGVGLSSAADGAPRLLAGQGLGAGLETQDIERLDLALVAGERHVGVLHLVLEDAPAPGWRCLLDGIASQVAAALARVRLYARMEALVVERTAALRSERNRLSAVVDTSGALVLLAEPDGAIALFNRACEESLGWTAADALGRPVWDILRDAADGDAARRLFAALADGAAPARSQGEWLDREGRRRTIVWTHTVLRREDGSVEYLLASGIDLTELRGAEARLHYVEHFDTLTGLPNRQLLRERLRQLQERSHSQGPDGTRVAGFMLLRFARIGLIRQALGPHAEQAVLEQAAGRLRQLAGADALGRHSDEGFVLASLRRDGDELALLARRLLASLGAPYVHAGEELHLDPCVGIALYPNDGRSYDDLVRCAEIALAQAADGAGVRYAFYRPELNQDANERFRLEAALRRAIEGDALALHYQPQVDLASGAIVGAEALLRWRHPERGMVAPDIFIPLAEESGLVLPLGEWVLKRACAQLRDWQRDGLPLVPISVNLSAHQFSEPIVGQLRRILAECDVAPGLLELELTESASMADAGHSCALLAQLKAMGVNLAIDDFGTGYSNLNYLKRFPVDKLKLDQSFVRDILNDADDLAIARAVVAMAHGLRLTVVAEGVECAGQLELLAALGCDLVQGFLFSPAVPPESFARMLVEGLASTSFPRRPVSNADPVG